MAHQPTVNYLTGTRMCGRSRNPGTIVGYIFYGECGLYYIFLPDGRDVPQELCVEELEEYYYVEEEKYV